MTEVVIIPVSPERYEARLGDEVLVKSHRDPEHAAARALLERGITGRMTTTGLDGKPRMHFDIETAAQWSITEDDRGLHRTRWKPFSRTDVEA
jgi:uncharacterized Rossmann fold enzyme